MQHTPPFSAYKWTTYTIRCAQNRAQGVIAWEQADAYIKKREKLGIKHGNNQHSGHSAGGKSSKAELEDYCRKMGIKAGGVNQHNKEENHAGVKIQKAELEDYCRKMGIKACKLTDLISHAGVKVLNYSMST